MRFGKFFVFVVKAAALITIIGALPAMAEPYIYSSQDVEHEMVISWEPTPVLVYTVETTTLAYKDGKTSILFMEPEITKAYESHICPLQDLGEGVLACDLPQLDGRGGIWVDRIVLDTKDQTALGTKAYIRPKDRSSQVNYPVVDHYEDGSHPAEQRSLLNINGNVYWDSIADYSCYPQARELASCNDRLMTAAQNYFDEKLAKAYIVHSKEESGDD